MHKVLLPLGEGFEEIEAISIIDILRRGSVDVTTATLNDKLAVSGAHGITVKADAKFSDVVSLDYDMIVLPGGPGTALLCKCEPLLERLRRQKQEGRFIAAICAAPLVLVKAGVIDADAHVTCYPSCEIELERPSAGVPVVVDDMLITGQAPGSATLFALVLLQVMEGDNLAQRIERSLVCDVLS